MLLIFTLLLATQLAESKPFKPDLDIVTLPPIKDLSFETQRHTLQNSSVGTTITIKLIPFSRVELFLHANRLGASDVVPLSITFKPKEKTLVFNSLVHGEYDYEERKWVPFNTYEEIQLDITLEEDKFFCVINEFWHKSFDYPFYFENLEFLTLKGYSLLLDVEEIQPESEVEEVHQDDKDFKDQNHYEVEQNDVEDSQGQSQDNEETNIEAEESQDHSDVEGPTQESENLHNDKEIEEPQENHHDNNIVDNTF